MLSRGVAFDCRQQMDGAAMLALLEPKSARLAIFDPQWRENLDHLNYGNEGVRQGRRAALPQMNRETILLIMAGIDRVLAPSGHLLLWTDKYLVVNRAWRRWIPDDFRLDTVDMITWDTTRAGMGYRARQRAQFLLCFQKPPRRAKDVWTDRGIDDVWQETVDRSIHPHAKPLALMTALVKSLTKRGDLVVDPAAGGYGMLEVCRATGRRFAGCDLADC